MQIFLETDRLILRQFTAADVDNLVELDSDPDVMRYINGGRPTPRAEVQDDLLPWFMLYYARFVGYGFWAAIEKSSGDFLGWFHFRPPKGARLDEVELGYRLRKSAWGLGYGTEGSRALVRKGFAELGVRRVVASAMAANIASRRVMEKAGLVLVRTFFQPWPDKIEGDELGDVEYALERPAWEVQAGLRWEAGLRADAQIEAVKALHEPAARLDLLAEDVEWEVVEPREFVAQPNTVVEIIHATGRARATGRAFESDVVRVWTFSGERVIRVRSYRESGSVPAAEVPLQG